MEPENEMQALTLDPEDLGLIKEGPVKRYLAGSKSKLIPQPFGSFDQLTDLFHLFDRCSLWI
jgi:hypothetical protein